MAVSRLRMRKFFGWMLEPVTIAMAFSLLLSSGLAYMVNKTEAKHRAEKAARAERQTPEVRERCEATEQTSFKALTVDDRIFYNRNCR